MKLLIMHQTSELRPNTSVFPYLIHSTFYISGSGSKQNFANLRKTLNIFITILNLCDRETCTPKCFFFSLKNSSKLTKTRKCFQKSCEMSFDDCPHCREVLVFSTIDKNCFSHLPKFVFKNLQKL